MDRFRRISTIRLCFIISVLCCSNIVVLHVLCESFEEGQKLDVIFLTSRWRFSQASSFIESFTLTYSVQNNLKQCQTCSRKVNLYPQCFFISENVVLNIKTRVLKQAISRSRITFHSILPVAAGTYTIGLKTNNFAVH